MDAPRPQSAPTPAVLPLGPILLVRLGAVGDVIRALPALDLLRRALPDAVIDWLVEERCAEVLREHPDLRQLVVLRRKAVVRSASRLQLPAALRTVRSTLLQLKEGRYAAVVDLQGTLKSALLARASGCPLRIGLAAGHAKEAAQRFYTHRVDPGSGRFSRVERNLRLLAPLGVDASRQPAPRALLPLGVAHRQWAHDVLASLAPGAGPRVVLYPGTSKRQAYKRWPEERFGELAGRLADHGVQVLVAGGPDEGDLIRAVVHTSNMVLADG